MDMDFAVEKYYKIAIKIIFTVIIFILFYIIIKYFLSFFAPFVIAVILTLVNEPVISLLENRARVPRKIAALISLLFTISILGSLLAFITVKVYTELVILKGNISSYISDASAFLSGYIDQITAYYNNLPINVSKLVDDNINKFTPQLESIIKSLINYSIDTITSIPKMAIFLIVTLLATYFISSDRREIRCFLYRQLPDKWVKNITGVKSDTFTAIFSYIKAVFILMLFTFVEAFVGFLLIRVDYALLMALLVAICEIIPFFGTGIIMVPWIMWNLITGNIQTALGLAIIYLLGILTRQILEPIIVKDHAGLHPLATLIAMYVGLSLFGVLGMIIGPLSILVLKNLQTSGLIKVWKD